MDMAAPLPSMMNSGVAEGKDEDGVIFNLRTCLKCDARVFDDLRFFVPCTPVWASMTEPMEILLV